MATRKAKPQTIIHINNPEETGAQAAMTFVDESTGEVVAEHADNQLVKITTETGLDKTKADVLIEKFQGYFDIARKWEEKAKNLVITDVTQITEMKMADNARKFLKDKRTDVEQTRVKLKESSLREGRTIDAIATLLKNLIEPLEKDFAEKANFIEIKMAKERDERKLKRMEDLLPYNVAMDANLLADMSSEVYNTYLRGVKQKHQDDLEEQARLEKEEEERLVKEAAENERIRVENEKLKADNAEKDRLAALEKAKQDKALKEVQEKAAKEKKDLEDKLAKQRKDSAEAAKKVKEAQDALLKSQKEAQEALQKQIDDKRLAEEKKAEEEEQKLQLTLSAGDIEKFVMLIADIEALKTKYTFKSKVYKKTYETINELLTRTINHVTGKGKS